MERFRTRTKEYSTFDFKDRVQAVAKAGFKGMGIWHADLDHILVESEASSR